jgi:sugar phosphate permease
VDRFGPRRILLAGMLLSAAACALFAEQTALWPLIGCFALNGLAQATGYPSCTNLVARAVAQTGRGRALGLWSTCYQVGGVAATAWATWLLGHHGYRAAFHGPALWLAAVAALCASQLPRTAALGSARPEPAQPVARRSALREPRLYSYGACYFCLKLIRYSLLFWLPYYLSTAAHLDASTSGYVSTAFEVGGVAGSVLLGALSDRRPHGRGGFAAVSMLLLALALWAYTRAPLGASLGWHVSMLALLGALVYGPDSLLSGAAAQEAASPHAAGTAVGLVNGLGSLGALFQAGLTVSVQHAFGWNGVFHAFVALSVLGALCLVPSVVLRRSRRHA